MDRSPIKKGGNKLEPKQSKNIPVVPALEEDTNSQTISTTVQPVEEEDGFEADPNHL